MDREALKILLPHREPMLLVDEVTACDDGSAKGRYTVTGQEWFLQGHFPGRPVVPGVVLCEMLAQACCVLLAGEATAEGILPFLTGIEKAKFRQPVQPGDTLDITCRLTKSRGMFYFAEGEGRVGGKLAVSATFSFALVEQA